MVVVLRNAIPRESNAIVAIDCGMHEEAFMLEIKLRLLKTIKKEYKNDGAGHR